MAGAWVDCENGPTDASSCSSGRVTGPTLTFLRIVHFDDNPHNGLNYYRLQQFDLDGQFFYSDISMTDFKSEDIMVYPNPSSGLLVVSMPKFESELNLQIIDGAGRIIHDLNYYHTREIHLNLLQVKGVYQLRITVGDSSHVERIVLN